MLESQRILKVFLCHASQDKPIVRELYQRLKAEEWIDIWFDEKKLLPGQDWRLNIEEAVETSDIVIICLSRNSVSKEGFVQKELRYAREISLEKPEESIFLIPLRIDECDVPRGLRFYQWADYFGEKKDETYNSLQKSLKQRYEQKSKIEKEERESKRERAEREVAEKNEKSLSDIDPSLEGILLQFEESINEYSELKKMGRNVTGLLNRFRKEVENNAQIPLAKRIEWAKKMVEVDPDNYSLHQVLNGFMVESGKLNDAFNHAIMMALIELKKSGKLEISPYINDVEKYSELGSKILYQKYLELLEQAKKYDFSNDTESRQNLAEVRMIVASLKTKMLGTMY